MLHRNQVSISKRFRDIWLQIYHDLDLLGVTWRHWSCDHLMPHIAFPIGVRVTTLTFQGHVTSSITWQFDSLHRVSYLNAKSSENFVPTKIGQILSLLGAWGSVVSKSCDFYSKRHVLAWIDVVWAILRQNRSSDVTSRSVRDKTKKVTETPVRKTCRRWHWAWTSVQLWYLSIQCCSNAMFPDSWHFTFDITGWTVVQALC